MLPTPKQKRNQRRRAQASGAMSGPAKMIAEVRRRPTPTDARLSNSRSTAQYRAPAAGDQLSHYVRMIADPKYTEPVGIPDENSSPVVVRKDVEVLTHSTNAAGYYALTVYNYLSVGHMTFTCAAGITDGGTGVAAGNYTALNAEFLRLRPIEFVVEVTYLGAAINSQGRLLVTQGTNAINATTLSTLLDNPGHEGPLIDGAFSIGRPYINPTFGLTSAVGNDFPVINIAITGAPALAPLEIRITRIMELLPVASSLRLDDARHTPCDMRACCIASNICGPQVTYGKHEDYSKAVASAMRLAATAARMFLPGAYNSALSALSTMFTG